MNREDLIEILEMVEERIQHHAYYLNYHDLVASDSDHVDFVKDKKENFERIRDKLKKEIENERSE